MTKQIKKFAAVLIAGAMILTMAMSVSANNRRHTWQRDGDFSFTESVNMTVDGTPITPLNTESFEGLFLNGEAISSSNFSFTTSSSGDGLTFTLKKEYLETLDEGEYTLAVHYRFEIPVVRTNTIELLLVIVELAPCGNHLATQYCDWGCYADDYPINPGDTPSTDTPAPDNATVPPANNTSTPFVVLNAFPTWRGTGSATVRIDLDHEDFEGLFLNGNAVAAANYTVTAGSTVITLGEDYLKSLGNGTHNFTATFAGGETVNIPLTVNVASSGTGSGTDGNPSTGVVFAIVPVLVAGAAAVIAKKRK
jgi:hypothetical protein